MNVMNALLGTLLDNPSALSKSAAAELVKANASQLVAALLKDGFDQQSAKVLIEYFTSTLLTQDKSSTSATTRKTLGALTRHFADLPALRTPADITRFKQGLDSLLKQMLHTLVPKSVEPSAHSPLQTYTQNQLLRHTELASALSGSIQDSEKSVTQRERREQTLFGLAENRENDTGEHGKKKKKEKRGNISETVQLLLSIRQSFTTVLQALLDFQKGHDAEEARHLLPDLNERIAFLKERIQECDAVLRHFY